MAYSNSNASSPILGDSLNKTITLSDEKKIGVTYIKTFKKATML